VIFISKILFSEEHIVGTWGNKFNNLSSKKLSINIITREPVSGLSATGDAAAMLTATGHGDVQRCLATATKHRKRYESVLPDFRSPMIVMNVQEKIALYFQTSYICSSSQREVIQLPFYSCKSKVIQDKTILQYGTIYFVEKDFSAES
jgi:hypothetical protein